jgi:hypothetical protein
VIELLSVVITTELLSLPRIKVYIYSSSKQEIYNYFYYL